MKPGAGAGTGLRLSVVAIADGLECPAAAQVLDQADVMAPGVEHGVQVVAQEEQFHPGRIDLDVDAHEAEAMPGPRHWGEDRVERRKASPVVFGRTLAQQAEVVGVGAVADVGVPPVIRKRIGQRVHQAVARDLGDDARGGDG